MGMYICIVSLVDGGYLQYNCAPEICGALMSTKRFLLLFCFVVALQDICSHSSPIPKFMGLSSLSLNFSDGCAGLLNTRRWIFVLFCGNPLLFYSSPIPEFMIRALSLSFKHWQWLFNLGRGGPHHTSKIMCTSMLFEYLWIFLILT